MVIRKSDRHVFITGIYYSDTANNINDHCFLIRTDHLGAVENSRLMLNTNGGTDYSHCYAIAYSEDNYVYAVGTRGENGNIGSLIIKTDEYLAFQTMKIWSFSELGYASEAYGVAVSSDGGSIYVVGYTNGWATAEIANLDVLILRLDQDLGLVWARSYGNEFIDDWAVSIEMSRGHDWLYIGGISNHNNAQQKSWIHKITADFGETIQA